MVSLFFDIFFFTLLAVLLFLSSVVYEYILPFKPINSNIGLPAASSLNLPIIFLFSPKNNLEDSGYSLLSNSNLSLKKSS